LHINIDSNNITLFNVYLPIISQYGHKCLFSGEGLVPRVILIFYPCNDLANKIGAIPEAHIGLY
jgi:hypothetical protein